MIRLLLSLQKKVLGIICGHQHLLPDSLNVADLSFYALCALMFFVGISVGCDPKTLLSFRQLNPRFALLPLMTIGGTLAGCLVVSLLLPHRSAADCCAIGSGFGYYSLSSIIITEYKGPAMGTIALLSNIMREIIALLAAPLLVRWFGKLAPIAVGGVENQKILGEYADTVVRFVDLVARQKTLVLFYDDSGRLQARVVDTATRADMSRLMEEQKNADQ